MSIAYCIELLNHYGGYLKLMLRGVLTILKNKTKQKKGSLIWRSQLLSKVSQGQAKLRHFPLLIPVCPFLSFLHTFSVSLVCALLLLCFQGQEKPKLPQAEGKQQQERPSTPIGTQALLQVCWLHSHCCF